MVVPFLALYLTQSLGFTPKQAGFLIGIYGVGALLMSPVVGHLCDRFGTLHVMIASLISGGGVMLAFPLAKSYDSLAVMAFLLAVTSEGFRPAAMTAIAEFTTATERKPGFALVRLAINLGMSVGPALGAFLLKISFGFLFWVDGLTCLAAAAVLWPSLRERERLLLATGEGGKVEAPAGAGGVLSALSDLRFVYFLFATLPVMLVFFQHETTLPLFMVKDLHLDEAWYGLCFTINTAIIVATEVPLTLATNHWPQKWGMILGAAFFALGFGLMAEVAGGWGVMGTVVLWTAGEMFMFPAWTTYVSEIAPSHQRGLYMGIYTMTFSVAFIIAPLFGTFVMENYGARPLWLACLGLGFLSTLLFFRIKHLDRIMTP